MSKLIGQALRLGRWAQHPSGAAPLGTPHCPRCFAETQTFALVALIVITSVSFSALTAIGQEALRREIVFPVSIQWNKQKGVSRYRLQIAADEKFQDVFFDGRVMGSRYIVSSLSPGYYYWRVAPADSQLGDFSRPGRFFLSGGVVTAVRLPGRAAGTRSLPATFGPKIR